MYCIHSDYSGLRLFKRFWYWTFTRKPNGYLMIKRSQSKSYTLHWLYWSVTIVLMFTMSSFIVNTMSQYAIYVFQFQFSVTKFIIIMPWTANLTLKLYANKPNQNHHKFGIRNILDYQYTLNKWTLRCAKKC